jgi:hypothetical protein
VLFKNLPTKMFDTNATSPLTSPPPSPARSASNSGATTNCTDSRSFKPARAGYGLSFSCSLDVFAVRLFLIITERYFCLHILSSCRFSFVLREQRSRSSQRPRVELSEVRMTPALFVFTEPAAITMARAAGG